MRPDRSALSLGDSALGEGELTDVGVAVPEQIRTAGQILHVAVVDLAGLDLHRFVLAFLQCLGPDVECLGVVLAEPLFAGQPEAGLLGVLSDGGRLGRGGGYYDRFLKKLSPYSVTAGVAFAFQVVESVPLTKNDVRVQKIVTEEKTIHC